MTKVKDTASRAMVTYEVKYGRAVHQVLEEAAIRIVERMQHEHPWTNRTGEAERSLQCEVFDAPGPRTRLIAFHGVPYGKFLETMQGGRFAVLFPTMRSEWPRVLAALRARLRRLS